MPETCCLSQRFAATHSQMPRGTVPCSSLRRSAPPNSSSKPVASGATLKIACPLSVTPEADVLEEDVAVVRDVAEHVRVGFALATLVVDEGHGGSPQYDSGACSCKSDPAGRSWRCYLAKLRKKGRSYVLSDLYAVGTYDQSLLEGGIRGACLQRYHVPTPHLPHNPHVPRIGYEYLAYAVSVGGA